MEPERLADDRVDRKDLDDLTSAAAGDLEALHRVMPVVYERIRTIANSMLTGDRALNWVRASSIIHNAYIRLINQHNVDFADASRVTAALATIMRRVVIDIARRETTLKRGGDVTRISLHAEDLAGLNRPVDALEVDDAMVALAAVCPQSARVAELRFWGGMEFEQIAAAMDLPLSRVRSRWNRAKAWLSMELNGAQGAGTPRGRSPA